MDVKKEMLAAYQKAYAENPGLEKFDRRRKCLLWGMFGIAALQKICNVISTSDSFSPYMLIGILIGLCLPGIFALAVSRGSWSNSFIFYVLAFYLSFDLVSEGIPFLTSGLEFSPFFYVVAVVESFYALYLFALAIWLTVPAKNRVYAILLNSVFKEINKKMREAANSQH